MLTLANALVAILLHSTAVLEDIPDGEWVAPGVEIKLIESIDVAEYGNPLTDMLGRVSFVDTAEGEKWRLVLVNTDNITVLEEGSEPERFPYSFEADDYVISPDNRYVVLTKDTLSGYNALRMNTDTGEAVQFICCPEDHYPGTLLVSNTGSVVSWFRTGITFYDSSLQEKNTITAYSGGTYLIDRVGDGSRVIIGIGTTISAYDMNGNLIWENSRIPMDDDIYFSRMAVSPTGNRLVAVSSSSRFTLLNLLNGEIVWSEDTPRPTNYTLFSCSGETVYRPSATRRHEDGTTNYRIDCVTAEGNPTELGAVEYSISGGFRGVAPFSSSRNGLVMYQINQYPGEKILVLADSNWKTLWSERVPRTARMISGTAYNIPHLSFGELSCDGTLMCTYTAGSLNVYRIGELR